MSATFKTSTNNSKLIYSPEIAGKVILEAESSILTTPEYHVCYGSFDRLTGKVTFVGCSIQSYDTLEQAQKGLIAFSGYGRPKEPFNPTRKRKGLAPLSINRNSDSRFSSGFSTLNSNTSNLSGLEDSLRKKWKI